MFSMLIILIARRQVLLYLIHIDSVTLLLILTLKLFSGLTNSASILHRVLYTEMITSSPRPRVTRSDLAVQETASQRPPNATRVNSKLICQARECACVWM